jgi:hypothetical protein
MYLYNIVQLGPNLVPHLPTHDVHDLEERNIHFTTIDVNEKVSFATISTSAKTLGQPVQAFYEEEEDK